MMHTYNQNVYKVGNVCYCVMTVFIGIGIGT